MQEIAGKHVDRKNGEEDRRAADWRRRNLMDLAIVGNVDQPNRFRQRA